MKYLRGSFVTKNKQKATKMWVCNQCTTGVHCQHDNFYIERRHLFWRIGIFYNLQQLGAQQHSTWIIAISTPRIITEIKASNSNSSHTLYKHNDNPNTLDAKNIDCNAWKFKQRSSFNYDRLAHLMLSPPMWTKNLEE